MPSIAIFYGIVVRMYFFDHNPPHFHAQFGSARALIRISDGQIIAGRLPTRLRNSSGSGQSTVRMRSCKIGCGRRGTSLSNAYRDRTVTGMTDLQFPMVDVVAVDAMRGHRLHLRFSTGEEGELSVRPLIDTDAPMLRPLKDEREFARVFLELGNPAWPSGFDLDAIALYMDMKERGLLRQPAA
ncbi:DUF4160 domain-containing protein [Jiella sp. M17.18]|uniref:DUF4160 domain-containing protein n=1 Tax=Jiella sp. M17.18 TaxID=3234247 RepID=UPI0034DE1CF8